MNQGEGISIVVVSVRKYNWNDVDTCTYLYYYLLFTLFINKIYILISTILLKTSCMKDNRNTFIDLIVDVLSEESCD